MNPDADSPALEGCETFQRQISDAADASAPLTPEIQAHLRSCADCAGFAEAWFPKGPVALDRPITVSKDNRLRQRILDAAEPETVPFPGAADRRTAWTAWVGRIAACLALTGLAWWLLDPTHSQIQTHNSAAAERTLAQSLAHTEYRMKHEQEILQTALADGGQRVRGDVEWTLSALEP